MPFAQKQTKQGKKANLLSLPSSLCFLSSFLFSLFSQSFLTQKTSSLSKSCSRFHHLKRKTHLSSLRAQFRAHTSSRAEETPPLCCSLFLQYYYKECFERKEREKRARCLWLYCCVHRFDWRKKHAKGD